MRRKGQTFALTAVVLSAFLIIVAADLNFSTIDTQQPTIQENFNHKLSQKPSIFNQAIGKDYSTKQAKKDLYSYNSFVQRNSEARGIDYNAFNFFILPDKGEYTVINYGGSSSTFSIDLNGENESKALETNQWSTRSFEPGEKRVKIHLKDESIKKSFNASKPKLMVHMEMESDNEVWRNQIVR